MNNHVIENNMIDEDMNNHVIGNNMIDGDMNSLCVNIKCENIYNNCMSEMKTIDETETRSDTSSDSEESTSSIQITKEFQEHVIKYVRLDDLMKQKMEEIAELKDEIAEIRGQLKPCEQSILTFLDKSNEAAIKITGGSLIKKQIEKKAPLNQDIIKSSLSEKVKDANIISEIMELIETKRPTSTRVDLKRTGNRKIKEPKKVTKKT